MEHVNHPKHYNQHPAGIECIDIIRHYTCDIANAIKYLWRAGLKAEMGMKDAEKEIEDLNKALWYIEDYRKYINKHATYTVAKAEKDSSLPDKVICEAQVGIVTGYDIADIVKGYNKHIATAMSLLLQVGLIHTEGRIFIPRTWRYMLDEATKAIQQRGVELFKEQLISLKPEPPTFKEVDIKTEVERWDVHSGFTGKVDIAQRRDDCPIPYALSYDFGPCQTKDELENQQISILERIAADCMAMADFIKKTQ